MPWCILGTRTCTVSHPCESEGESSGSPGESTPCCNPQTERIQRKTRKDLERIDKFDESEVDAIMSLIPEAQFERMAVGTPCLDKDGKRFTVIGIRQSDSAEKLKHNFDFENKYATIAGLSYDALAPE